MIRITRRIALEESEIRLAFVRSSGPGGQNVNKVATAVQLRFDVAHSPSLPPDVRERLTRLAGKRVTTEGVLVLDARRYRTQEGNRRDALERLVQWVRRAAQPPRKRKPTRPTQASREERRETKRRRSELKRGRGPVRLALALVFLLAGAAHAINPAEPPTGNRAGLTLAETCDLYLRALGAGDLRALMSVASDSAGFVFLAPSGERCDRSGFRRFHADWYRGPDWALPVELLALGEGMEEGHALVHLDYQTRAPGGEADHLESYLTLVFRREEGLWRIATAVCTPIRRYAVSANSDLAYDAASLVELRALTDRRAVRRFGPAPVPAEHLRRILGAARVAEGGLPPVLLVVREPQRLEDLRRQAARWSLESYREWYHPPDGALDSLRAALTTEIADQLSAPVFVAVLVDQTTTQPEAATEAGTLAAADLMSAARALGYGSGFLTTFFPPDRMREFLDLPQRYRLLCLIPIGVPETCGEAPEPAPSVLWERFE
jgi:ribosome-associated protein